MRHISIERIAFTGLMAMTLALMPTPAARAADLALSNIPLFIELDVKPNLVVTLDDSGSMRGCFILDGSLSENSVAKLFTASDFNDYRHAYRGVASSDVNDLYYNPNIEYVVPVDANGVSLGAPSFNSAFNDGYDQAGSGTRDLSASFKPCWSSLGNWLDPVNPGSGLNDGDPPPPTPAGRAAYYYKYVGTTPIDNSKITVDANFKKIVVGDLSGALGDAPDTGGFGNTTATKQQNFANWFSYYRNRILTMKSAAGRGFTDGNLRGRIRVAYQTLWGLNGTDATRTDISLMKLFDGQGRTDFFNWLYGIQNEGGTPLRYSLDKVGHYYMNQEIDGSSAGHGYKAKAAVDSPWAFEPGVTQEPELPCRQAFHALLTDGQWNSDAGVSGNVDNTNKNYPEALANGDTAYDTAVLTAPYKDTNSATLADNAFFYWINDLRPDLANNVPPFIRESTPHPITLQVEDNPRNDPATWQHMVNFTVGFGVDGALNFPDDYDALVNGTKDWNAGNRIDDLWHAAINSRGAYLSAKNPQELVDVFTVTLKDVFARVSSGASVALNSASLDANSRLYQARFDSGEWSGTVLAFDIDDITGAIQTPAAWDAAALLTTKVQGTGWDASRVVVTFDGTAGVPFRWGSLSASMQTELNKNGEGIADAAGEEQGQARLEYLRGSEANEGTGNNYRVRGGKLGDIVNGAPVFVGAPAFNYPDILESAPYSAFRTAKETRTPMVYVGANDGMLHGLNADSGQELIAYVPRIVVPNLTRLTSKSYPHRFFVDGPPTVGDVFYSSAWHTILVGGLRKGGQGIYALDVTDPAQFASEATASTLVRWEFTDTNDADLGYTYSRPAIVRMKNGKWAAVFGNGYNNTEADGNASSTGNAVLFIVDIETGALIKKIDTGAGMTADPSGNSRPNGLATASPVDVDGDRIIDYIYAGDLFGNLWKFNVTSSDPNAWAIAYAGDPLFVAMDATGTRQPITTRPEVGFHPVFKTGSAVFANGGYMIYFGTGQYIETGDNKTTNVQTQTFYGVWDPDRATLPPSFDRNHLLQQQIENETTVTIGVENFDVRLTSNNGPIVWRDDPLVDAVGDMGWFMDLINVGVSPAVNNGERQVTDSILRPDGRIVFTTLIPSGSSCEFGGSGFLMELDATDGSRLSDPPFDFDNDGVFDLVDFGFGVIVAPGGVRSRSGAPATPGILPAANQREEYKYVSGTDAGKIDIIHESATAGTLGKGTRESWRQIQ